MDLLLAFRELDIRAHELRLTDKELPLSREATDFLSSIDVVCKVVHGYINRVGIIQSTLDLLRRPYAGNSLKTDLFSQNKLFVKAVMREAGIPTPRHLVLPEQRTYDVDALAGRLGSDRFVFKPVETNSSIGIRYLAGRDKFAAFCEELPKEFGEYFVEEFVPGRVYTVGIVPASRGLYATYPLEYISNTSPIMDCIWKRDPQRVLARHLPDRAVELMHDYAERLHRFIGAEGITRSDFIVTDEGKVVALEINTNVGLSSSHDVATAITAYGDSYNDLAIAHLNTAFRKAI